MRKSDKIGEYNSDELEIMTKRRKELLQKLKSEKDTGVRQKIFQERKALQKKIKRKCKELADD